MVNVKYSCLLLVWALIASCKKEKEVSPQFEVTVANTSVKAGEKVTFNITGDAKVITFYSGEFKNDYAFKTGRILNLDVAKLAFTSRVQFGTQANQIKVLTSTDFTGDYTIAALRAAKWNDVTSRFTLATTTTNVTSEKEITDQIVDGKPLYIAFKHVTLPQTANGTTRTWTLSGLVLTTQTALGASTAMDQRTAAWSLIQSDNVVDPSRSTVSSAGTLTLRGNASATPEVETEIWAVSKAINLGKVDLGPDFGVPIKNTLNNRLQNYTYTFANAGTYKVTFVASNVSIYGQESVTKEITLTVNP